MIVIIEGNRGVGKTAVAKALAARLHAPIIRPFRPNLEHHHNGRTPDEAALRALGIPANTHVDDMYVADILSAIITGCEGQSFNFVLDRSMGSAIAHGTCPADVRALMDAWQRLLFRAGDVRYVWLRAPYWLAKQRASERMYDEAEWRALDGRFSDVYHMFCGSKRSIDTSMGASVDAVADLIINWDVVGF